MQRYAEQIQKIYSEFESKGHFEDLTLVVFNQDGTVVVNLEKSESDLVTKTVLMAGAWQASCSLLNAQDFQTDKVLSLGNTTSGFYVIPLKEDLGLCIGLLYKDALNPGKLKVNLKKLKSNLDQQIIAASKTSAQSNEKYMFDNITDDEVDKLFSFAGI